MSRINQKYYIGDNRIKTNLSDYDFCYYNKNSDYKFSKDILFKEKFTENGIFLRHQNLDSAVIGYNKKDFEIETLQIQGGRKRFKQLTPIAWDKILLEELINHSKKLEEKIKRITVIPWFKVQGDELYLKENKLKKRYDNNAKDNNFKYSHLEKLYILEL